MAKSPSAQSDQVIIPVSYPPDSEVKVEIGKSVTKGQLLAIKPAPTVSYDLAKKLKLSVSQISPLLKKQIGEPIETGDVLVEKKGWFRAQKIVSQVSGTVVSLEEGVVHLQIAAEAEEVHSPLSGKITELDDQLITIESPAESVKTAWSWGPLVWGYLTVVGDHDSGLELEQIKGDFNMKILVISGKLTKALWHKLSTLGTTGVICSQVPEDFDQWLDVEEEQQASDHSHIAIAVVKSGEELKFPQSVWDWLSNRVGHIAVLDRENNKISICKEI